MIKIGLSRRKNITKGADKAAAKEPRETRRVARAKRDQIAVAMRIAFGESARKTPRLVATPFPPLNFKKMVQL